MDVRFGTHDDGRVAPRQGLRRGRLLWPGARRTSRPTQTLRDGAAPAGPPSRLDADERRLVPHPRRRVPLRPARARRAAEPASHPRASAAARASADALSSVAAADDGRRGDGRLAALVGARRPRGGARERLCRTRGPPGPSPAVPERAPRLVHDVRLGVQPVAGDGRCRFGRGSSGGQASAGPSACRRSPSGSTRTRTIGPTTPWRPSRAGRPTRASTPTSAARGSGHVTGFVRRERDVIDWVRPGLDGALAHREHPRCAQPRLRDVRARAAGPGVARRAVHVHVGRDRSARRVVEICGRLRPARDRRRRRGAMALGPLDRRCGWSIVGRSGARHGRPWTCGSRARFGGSPLFVEVANLGDVTLRGDPRRRDAGTMGAGRVIR